MRRTDVREPPLRDRARDEGVGLLRGGHDYVRVERVCAAGRRPPRLAVQREDDRAPVLDLGRGERGGQLLRLLRGKRVEGDHEQAESAAAQRREEERHLPPGGRGRGAARARRGAGVVSVIVSGMRAERCAERGGAARGDGGAAAVGAGARAARSTPNPQPKPTLTLAERARTSATSDLPPEVGATTTRSQSPLRTPGRPRARRCRCGRVGGWDGGGRCGRVGWRARRRGGERRAWGLQWGGQISGGGPKMHASQPSPPGAAPWQRQGAKHRAA